MNIWRMRNAHLRWSAATAASQSCCTLIPDLIDLVKHVETCELSCHTLNPYWVDLLHCFSNCWRGNPLPFLPLICRTMLLELSPLLISLWRVRICNFNQSWKFFKLSKLTEALHVLHGHIKVLVDILNHSQASTNGLWPWSFRHGFAARSNSCVKEGEQICLGTMAMVLNWRGLVP